MAASRAERRAANRAPARASTPPVASLGRRQLVELALPGVLIGVLGGVLATAMSAAGGLDLDVAVVAGVALGVPLALAGAGYELLLAHGRFPLGVLTPIALYWAIAFPVARVIDAGLLELYAGAAVAVPHGWLDFVVYQVLLSVAYAIGYWWLHENFAPRWWFHLRDRNAVAEYFIRRQLDYAGKAEPELQRRRDRNRRKKR